MVLPSPAHHTPDLIVVNGRITTMAAGDDPAEVEAVAVVGDRISAVGTTDEIRSLAGPATSVVDVQGRRVIPGLIDSHVHIMRAGRTWNDEVRWENEQTLDSALDAIRRRAAALPPGTWIRTIGGWHPGQFSEGRGPTREELDAVAPDHPVYVQFLYDWAVLNTAALRAIDLDDELVRELGAEHFETDADGELTGKVTGTQMMKWFYRRMPTPTFEEQIASTAAMARELNRLGITGAIDGGGMNSGPDTYRAIYETWRRGLLTVRTRLTVHPSEAGTEFEEFAGYQRFTPLDLGDGILSVLGAGELILYRSLDKISQPADVGEGARHDFLQIFRDLARSRWTIHAHAHQHETIDAILSAWEKVHAEYDISGLRWSLVHAEPLKPVDLERLKALGGGVLAQGLFRFQGEDALKIWGAEVVAEAPPFRKMLEMSLPVGLGSDAMRVASYNPFTTLAWFLTGLTVHGNRTLAPHNLLSREEALRGYTASGAWFSFEEAERGRLQPGYLADLAVLSEDYFAVEVERIPLLESLLTIVGGQVVYRAEPFDNLPVTTVTRPLGVSRV
ncbi:amidohydrolase [Streptosporangium sp. NBC_01755]|uniref:amidohydrolase n=1 Tax=unclassified Streptosporangium TaxID=2632669 RepID=UPI002DD8C6B7|nr:MULTISPECIES: amidohydrolase [unclassified Streptosporangium]WSA28305.1 amidohydrolase [Streptosporangium sp. NBC_01810]WSD00217.1 amidohydrolase [Streptosporangium sp. NBC_01755]